MFKRDKHLDIKAVAVFFGGDDTPLSGPTIYRGVRKRRLSQADQGRRKIAMARKRVPRRPREDDRQARQRDGRD
jgi:hypothetical protein